MPILDQKTQQSYNFKGISSGSSDENIFFTADGVKFEGHGFAIGEKIKYTSSDKSMSAWYDTQSNW